MSKDNDWKSRLSIVYSTNPEFNYNSDSNEESSLLPKDKQQLRIRLDKKNRAGKVATLVSGFSGGEDDLADLARWLKTKLGVGGSFKEGEIIIQGDFRTRVLDILNKEGYTKSRII